LIGTATETAHRSELLCAPQTVLPAGDRGGLVESTSSQRVQNRNDQQNLSVYEVATGQRAWRRDFYALQNVPLGEVRAKSYLSKTTGSEAARPN
jgi:hypothetical protein